MNFHGLIIRNYSGNPLRIFFFLEMALIMYVILSKPINIFMELSRHMLSDLKLSLDSKGKCKVPHLSAVDLATDVIFS